MSKVLLVDTNFSSGPIYDELILMGHEVHVVGGNPYDCLAKTSGNYWNIDYSDTPSLAKLIEKQRFDYLVPGCTDRSYESCVTVGYGKYPGLDHPEAYSTINNKAKFRQLAESIDLPIPKIQYIHHNNLHYPLLVKPVDSFSGKGISILEAPVPNALEIAIKKAQETSSCGEYLIEDFVYGQLYSHSAFIQDGQIILDFIVQENNTANPFVVDTSRVLQEVDSNLLTCLRYYLTKLINELQLQDGLLHTQFISNDTNFWLIELTRRCPGDLYSQLIELSTQYRYTRSYVLPFLGRKIPQHSSPISYAPIMRHTVTVKTEQNIAFVRFKQSLIVERWVPLCTVGDQLKPSPQSRVGVLFARAADHSELNVLYQATLARSLYEIANANNSP
jgi:ATP-grasp domain